MTVGVLKVWETHRARSVRLTELKTMAELANLLPDKSAARKSTIEHIEARISNLVRDEQTKRRDATGFTLGLLFTAGGLWATYGAISSNSWLWALAVPLLIFGVTGIVQDGVPRERDERGRALRGSRNNSKK
ncbi:hypothetical protein ACFPM7_26395 [Actinokineospora guangxiensis]|uniref:DUF2335 domain-containing protein n=1 Tax=Actinokineospora guangxiensis TaxID=1490288 RepID=A0ABW0EWP0_9PSEU